MGLKKILQMNFNFAKLFFVLSLLFLSGWDNGVLAQKASEADRAIPYTLADRDRAVRMEERLNQMDKRMDIMQEQTNQSIQLLTQATQKLSDDVSELKTTMYTSIISVILVLVGFLIWDRRAALKPMEDKINQVVETIPDKNKIEQLFKALRHLSEKDPQLASTLKQFNLL